MKAELQEGGNSDVKPLAKLSVLVNLLHTANSVSFIMLRLDLKYWQRFVIIYLNEFYSESKYQDD